jgi:hypothetical protein
MNAVMFIERGTLTEGFPTFFTFVRFYTSMDSLMTTEERMGGEGFLTLVTFVRLFS